MLSRVAADALVVVHLGFVVFVLLGGLLVLRWPRLAWVHLPCAVWGFFIEVVGWICPLTPLENRLRAAGGEAGYEGGFVEHYVMKVLYPEGLTRGAQLGIAVLVVLVNLVVYGILRRRLRRPRQVVG